MEAADRLRGDPTRAREPKYYAVKRHLLRLIESSPPGAMLPTERALSTQLQTSRTTVRLALAELVGEGRLVRRQGSGTYVAEPKIRWPLQMTSFTEQASAHGFRTDTRLLEATRTPADADVADRLSIRRGASTFRITRLRQVDDVPMAVETSHLPAARFPGLLGTVRRTESLYGVLADAYGVRPAEAEETIETALAAPRESALLGIEAGAPILVLGRHTLDGDGAPIEYVRSWYRGDRYVFVARLTAP